MLNIFLLKNAAELRVKGSERSGELLYQCLQKEFKMADMKMQTEFNKPKMVDFNMQTDPLRSLNGKNQR